MQDGGFYLNTSIIFVKELHAVKFRELVHFLLHSGCSHHCPASLSHCQATSVLIGIYQFHYFKHAFPCLVAVISWVGCISMQLTNNTSVPIQFICGTVNWKLHCVDEYWCIKLHQENRWGLKKALLLEWLFILRMGLLARCGRNRAVKQSTKRRKFYHRWAPIGCLTN